MVDGYVSVWRGGVEVVDGCVSACVAHSSLLFGPVYVFAAQARERGVHVSTPNLRHDVRVCMGT